MAETDEPIAEKGGQDGAAPAAGDETRIITPRSSAPATAPPSLGGNRPSRPDTGTLHKGQLLAFTYEIESLLARGGMGEVYRARHTELGSIHAIKVIRPELADSQDIITLFANEAANLRMVRHDAVVAYDGMFRDESGLRYLVMEFVDGVSLAKVMRERQLTPAEVRHLRDRLAQGLAAAHDRGIYHRDISPDNIILVDGRVELAKIIDFGIAKATGAQHTVIGSGFAGKYSYVSPEQLGLYGGQVDGRSDLYSLGLVLVAALLGQPLPMGDTPVSAIEARRSVPDLSAVPADLRAELAPLLEPDPSRRPASARELPGSATAETRVTPATTVRPPPSPPQKPSGGSHVMRWSLAALAVLVIAGGAGAYFLLEPVKPHRVAVDLPPPVPPTPSPPANPPPQAVVATPPTPSPPANPPPQVAMKPAPPPAPPVDRNVITASVATLTQQFNCADINTTLANDLALEVSGFVASGADQAKLQQALAAVPGVARVDAAVDVYQWPHCQVVKLLQDAGALSDPASAPKLGFNHPNLSYRGGDSLVVRATLPGAADGYLIVDFYDTSGKVIHLFPRLNHAANSVRGREMVTIGSENGKEYEIDEPYGPTLIVAIFSRQQLIRARPANIQDDTEDATAYLSSLGRGFDNLAKTQGGRVSGSYTFINTVPK